MKPYKDIKQTEEPLGWLSIIDKVANDTKKLYDERMKRYEGKTALEIAELYYEDNKELWEKQEKADEEERRQLQDRIEYLVNKEFYGKSKNIRSKA